jgi:hypothetical protein
LGGRELTLFHGSHGIRKVSIKIHVFERENDVGLGFFVIYGTGDSGQEAGLHSSGCHYPAGLSMWKHRTFLITVQLVVFIAPPDYGPLGM